MVLTEPASAAPVLRLREGEAARTTMRVTWTPDTVEINEFSGKRKSKSASVCLHTNDGRVSHFRCNRATASCGRTLTERCAYRMLHFSPRAPGGLREP